MISELTQKAFRMKERLELSGYDLGGGLTRFFANFVRN